MLNSSQKKWLSSHRQVYGFSPRIYNLIARILYRIFIQYAMYKPFKLMIMRNVFIGYFIVFAQYINTFVSIKTRV